MNTKEKILAEAVKLFATKGFAETGTDEVVQKSNVAKGLLFYHYKSKQGLLKAVLGQAEEIIQKSCEVDISGQSAQRALRSLIRQMVNSLKKDRDYWQVYSAVLLNPGLTEKLNTELRHPSEAYYHIAPGLFRKMGKKNPKRWTLFFDVQFRGIASGYLTSPKSFPLDDARQMMVDMLTR